jgi:hypothetical protein
MNPWLGGYCPQIPVLCPLSSTEFVDPPPKKNSWLKPPPRKNSWVCHFSQHTFSLLYIVRNRELYKSNPNIHSINTRHSTDLHPSISKLITFQEGAYDFGIKVFNNFTPSLKILSNELKHYRPALKPFLLTKSFYSLDEYFNWNWTEDLVPDIQL